ncbi:unnamed protein product [Tilletia controversa]|nr:unnamed protein product [Tilletia controversa]
MVQPSLISSQQSATAANTTPLTRDSSITSILTSSYTTDSQELENPSTSSSAATSCTHLDLSPFDSGTPQASSIEASDGSGIGTPDILPELHNALHQNLKNAAESSENSTVVQQSSASMRVLLVDDNPLNLALLLRLLHRRLADKLDPAQPPIALTDAKVALDLLRGTLPLVDAISIATPPAVSRSVPNSARAVAAANALTNQTPTFTHIMLDIHMPAISGLSLARRIRSLPLSSLNREAKLLACTTAVRAQERRFYRSGGFDGLIEKPVREDTLRAFFDHLADEGLVQSRLASSVLEDVRPSGSSSQLTGRSNIGNASPSASSPAQDVSEGFGSLSLGSRTSRHKTEVNVGGKKEIVALSSSAIFKNHSRGLGPAATEDRGDLSRVRGLTRSVSVGSTQVQHKSFFLALRDSEPVILPPCGRDRYQGPSSSNQISCASIKDHVEDELIRSPHYLTQGFFLLGDDEGGCAVSGQATGLDNADAISEPHLGFESQGPACIVRQLDQVSAAPIDIRDLYEIKREVDLDSFRLEGTYFDAANHVVRHEEGSVAQEAKGLSDAGSSDGPVHDGTVATSRLSVTSLAQELMHSSPSIASPDAGKTPSPGPATHFIYAAPRAAQDGTMVLDLEQELASELEGVVAGNAVQQPRTDEATCASSASMHACSPACLSVVGVECSLPLLNFAPPSA